MGIDDNEKKGSEEGSRARNRTVMLTPDVTSQVRNRLAQEIVDDPSGAPPSRGGFETPVRGQFGGAGSRAASDAGRPTPVLAHSVQAPTPTPAVQTAEGVYWAKESPIIGFLVAYDRNENGEVFELRSGRLMVTTSARGDESAMVLQDDTVSPMHAVLRIDSEGGVQVLDQLSEHGTSVTRRDGTTVSLSGDKGEIRHGDVVSFGARAFHVCIIPRSNETKTEA